MEKTQSIDLPQIDILNLWQAKYQENEKGETKIFSSRIEDFQVQWVKYFDSDIMLRYNPNFSKNVRHLIV